MHTSVLQTVLLYIQLIRYMAIHNKDHDICERSCEFEATLALVIPLFRATKDSISYS